MPKTRIFPHSAICQLIMVDPAGKGWGGTGFYIGPNRILTCAHNLHGMTRVTIIPAKNGSDEPFGRRTLNASSWRVSNRYPGDGSNFDLAVIDNVPIAAPGGQWFGFLNQTPSDRLPIVVCGYSAQSDAVPGLTRAIDGDMQHLHGGYVTQQSNLEVMEYPILTLHGASGSPVYHISGEGAQLRALVCGVHVSGEPAAHGLNRGCFITPSKIDWIERRTTALSLSSGAEQSFTLNWDEVELIPQPTDLSCWAAAAAMVVGWKEMLNLSPETIAKIAGRTTATGLVPAQVEQFAREIGLVFEYPQSYTVDGFRRLLEAKGPLWIGAAVPGLHAIVVTGMYQDGTNTFVRITDPWDRQVGRPGAPGTYLATHSAGSRYIMRWKDFVGEYERAATDYSRVNLQILHSGSTVGHKANHGSPSPPPGYAQSLAARAGAARPEGYSRPTRLPPPTLTFDAPG